MRVQAHGFFCRLTDSVKKASYFTGDPFLALIDVYKKVHNVAPILIKVLVTSLFKLVGCPNLVTTLLQDKV